MGRIILSIFVAGVLLALPASASAHGTFHWYADGYEWHYQETQGAFGCAAAASITHLNTFTHTGGQGSGDCRSVYPGRPTHKAGANVACSITLMNGWQAVSAEHRIVTGEQLTCWSPGPGLMRTYPRPDGGQNLWYLYRICHTLQPDGGRHCLNVGSPVL
jgi:hypothetical protein